jgi:hypothetical protein
VSLLLLKLPGRRFLSSSLCGLGCQFKVGLNDAVIHLSAAVHDSAGGIFEHSVMLVTGRGRLEVKDARP